jgi:hypothetical protein
MRRHNLRVGDQVAIVPYESAPAELVSEIAKIQRVNGTTIHLESGRVYCKTNGQGLTAGSRGIIVPATMETGNRFGRGTASMWKRGTSGTTCKQHPERASFFGPLHNRPVPTACVVPPAAQSWRLRGRSGTLSAIWVGKPRQRSYKLNAWAPRSTLRRVGGGGSQLHCSARFCFLPELLIDLVFEQVEGCRADPFDNTTLRVIGREREAAFQRVELISSLPAAYNRIHRDAGNVRPRGFCEALDLLGTGRHCYLAPRVCLT